ncbi:cell division protein SepF [Actinomycetes bacterium KLBMP 9759]
MGAMYRLKAYFGMVPAEEMGEYTDEPERYAPPRRSARGEYPDERWDDRYARDDEHDHYDDEWDRRPPRPVSADRPLSSLRDAPRGAQPPVRGALAIDPESALHEPVRRPERPAAATAVPEQRDPPARGAAALARITTLQPRSYKEARTIGERYRDGVPVIMNLTELDAADAKRLVDFAAGLAFALRGSIDKVTNRVFLLTPADVEVSADDARKLAQRSVGTGRVDAERGFLRQD